MHIGDLGHPRAGEMPNVSPAELSSMLDYHFTNSQPLLVWGPPGVGKSDLIKNFATRKGIGLIDLNLSLLEPVDLIGLPFVKNINGVEYTQYAIPAILPTPTEEGGILFLDEINRASTPVLNSCLKLVLDRALNGYTLPDNWIVVAAANRMIDDPESLTKIGSALGNRFAQLNLQPRAEDWLEWARTKIDGKANVHPYITDFIEFAENNLYRYQADMDGDIAPWASPRTWALASREFSHNIERWEQNYRKGSNEVMAANAEVKIVISKYVGEAVALEFAEFIKTLMVFDFKRLGEVFTAPDRAPLPPVATSSDAKKSKVSAASNDQTVYRLDVLYAVANSISDAALNKAAAGKLTTSDIVNLCKYCTRLKNVEAALKITSSITKPDGYPHLFKGFLDKECTKPTENPRPIDKETGKPYASEMRAFWEMYKSYPQLEKIKDAKALEKTF